MSIPVEGWDANLHLLLKLIGASLATGLERAQDRELLIEMNERNELVAATANDGIWDFDGESKRINLSRRWKAMLGYDAGEEDVLLDWYHLVHPSIWRACNPRCARISRASPRSSSPCIA